MKRVGMSELIKATGLSRATIDRALNGRGGVHERTKRVIEETLRRLGDEDGRPDADGRVGHDDGLGIDMVLRVGRGLHQQICAAKTALCLDALTIHDMYQRNEDEILDQVVDLCRDPSRPLILTAKNAEPLRAELVKARKGGKQIVTFVSDLSHDAREAFVGIDNRNAGQTAAFVLGSLLKERSAMVGVVLGDYAFRCHEDREIGFRSNLRANFSSVQIADVAKGEDSAERTYEAVRDLLKGHPTLDAIYNVAGGNLGLAQAVRESGRSDKIYVMTHEANHITAPLVRAGVVQYVIAQSPTDLLDTAMALVQRRHAADFEGLHFVDFGVYTKFNLPHFEGEVSGLRVGGARQPNRN